MKVISNKKGSLRDAIVANCTARVDHVPISWDFGSPALSQVEWPISEYEIAKNEILAIGQMNWPNETIRWI